MKSFTIAIYLATHVIGTLAWAQIPYFYVDGDPFQKMAAYDKDLKSQGLHSWVYLKSPSPGSGVPFDLDASESSSEFEVHRPPFLNQGQAASDRVSRPTPSLPDDFRPSDGIKPNFPRIPARSSIPVRRQSIKRPSLPKDFSPVDGFIPLRPRSRVGESGRKVVLRKVPAGTRPRGSYLKKSNGRIIRVITKKKSRRGNRTSSKPKLVNIKVIPANVAAKDSMFQIPKESGPQGPSSLSQDFQVDPIQLNPFLGVTQPPNHLPWQDLEEPVQIANVAAKVFATNPEVASTSTSTSTKTVSTSTTAAIATTPPTPSTTIPPSSTITPGTTITQTTTITPSTTIKASPSTAASITTTIDTTNTEGTSKATTSSTYIIKISANSPTTSQAELVANTPPPPIRRPKAISEQTLPVANTIGDAINFSCGDRKYGFYVNKTDCQQYFICMPNAFGGGRRWRFTCGPGTVFSSKHKACVHNRGGGCQDE